MQRRPAPRSVSDQPPERRLRLHGRHKAHHEGTYDGAPPPLPCPSPAFMGAAPQHECSLCCCATRTARESSVCTPALRVLCKEC